MFSGIFVCFGLFSGVLGCSGVFSGVSGCFGVSSGVFGCFKWFWCVLDLFVFGMIPPTPPKKECLPVCSKCPAVFSCHCFCFGGYIDVDSVNVDTAVFKT